MRAAAQPPADRRSRAQQGASRAAGRRRASEGRGGGLGVAELGDRDARRRLLIQSGRQVVAVGLSKPVQWRRVWDGAVSEPGPNGVRLTLPIDRAGAVAALAASEQECCRFFGVYLRLDGARLFLEVRARAEGAALLSELFADRASSSR